MENVSLKGEYVKVIRQGEAKNSCGGNQDWFRGTSLDIAANQGCGMIAAMDVANYLSGIKEITFEDYMEKANGFLRQNPLAKFFLREYKRKNKSVFAVGILPSQICNYLNHNSKDQGKYVWNGMHGHKDMYEIMKSMLAKNIPVIWSIYNKTGKLNLYKYNEKYRKYELASSTNNHFVTAIGIQEEELDGKRQRMVEVSSWGNSYFIDYDEYQEFVGNSIINSYCSNIVIKK